MREEQSSGMTYIFCGHFWRLPESIWMQRVAEDRG